MENQGKWSLGPGTLLDRYSSFEPLHKKAKNLRFQLP